MMSAFFCVTDNKAAVLVTDGAGYDDNGVIMTLCRKITLSKNVPFAVTTRGAHEIGLWYQQYLCELADKGGVQYALKIFEDILPSMQPDPDLGGMDFLHFHIAAFCDRDGPCQFSANNIPGGLAQGKEPQYTMMPRKGIYGAGTPVTGDLLRSNGIGEIKPGEALSDFFIRHCGDIMEAMRQVPGTTVRPDGSQIQFLVGGQVDLTVVTSEGATVTTVRTWPDRIGSKIEPFAGSNVAPMNRQQRRAQARTRRKCLSAVA